MADDENQDAYLDRPNRRQGLVEGDEGDRRVPARSSSAVIMIIITVGGWDTLEGAKPLQIAYIVLYLGMAFLVMRWNRGVLPLAAALAIVLLIFAAVSGPAWFDRDKAGLTDPTLDEDILGLLSPHPRPGPDPPHRVRDARLPAGLERRGREARATSPAAAASGAGRRLTML